MSEVFDSLKKADVKVGLVKSPENYSPDKASNPSDIKDMEISYMKRQILETLKKKDSARAVIEDPKPAVSREDILKAMKLSELKPGVSIHPGEKDGASVKYEKLKAELDGKDAVIRDLEKRLKGEQDRAAISAEMTKARDKRLAEAEKLSGLAEKKRDLARETRAAQESLQSEHKKEALGRDETAKLLKILRAEADIKDKSIHDLQKKVERLNELEEILRVKDKKAVEARVLKELEDSKKLNDEYRLKLGTASPGADIAESRLAAEIDEIAKERDRAATNVESLRSKLYVAVKETKEQIAKIAQAEEALRNKEKKILEIDKLRTALDAEKAELESKLRAAENDNKNLIDKYARLNDELAGGKARIESMEKSYKELEAIRTTTLSQLQESLRANRALESKLEQVRLELGAKTTRLSEADNLYKELDISARELTEKLQASQRLTKELEASNESLALQLSNAHRDKKICETRISEMASETEAKMARLESVDKLHKEMELIIKESESKLQTIQGRIGEMEKEAARLTESLKSSPVKLKEAEDAAKNEIERLSAELTAIKSSIRQKEKNELEFKASIEQLEVDMQARDSKIEGDIKYTEKIVREVSELRKKLAALQRLPERTKSADA